MWLQERIAAKDFSLEKLGTKNNLSDIMTKAMSSSDLFRRLKNMGLKSSGSKSKQQEDVLF